MADISRNDQIVHRFYVKTLGVLADARLRREGTEEPKLDKWVSLWLVLSIWVLVMELTSSCTV
jgi:hypothetical protein